MHDETHGALRALARKQRDRMAAAIRTAIADGRLSNDSRIDEQITIHELSHLGITVDEDGEFALGQVPMAIAGVRGHLRGLRPLAWCPVHMDFHPADEHEDVQ